MGEKTTPYDDGNAGPGLGQAQQANSSTRISLFCDIDNIYFEAISHLYIVYLLDVQIPRFP